MQAHSDTCDCAADTATVYVVAYRPGTSTAPGFIVCVGGQSVPDFGDVAVTLNVPAVAEYECVDIDLPVKGPAYIAESPFYLVGTGREGIAPQLPLARKRNRGNKPLQLAGTYG